MSEEFKTIKKELIEKLKSRGLELNLNSPDLEYFNSKDEAIDSAVEYILICKQYEDYTVDKWIKDTLMNYNWFK